ncbi:hypothetical protein QYM36_006233 [Artemia franciscana]|uniref:Small integral membrane protein 20 n=1 Tax=Artemia franciscana TaxID=6661 RepID=A0AA88LDC5_ARTSF|nr:hypothetical protein QYM36_006233 [Artemia franciscana]
MSYRMSGWKYGAFIGGIVGFIGLALYPTVIYPMQHIDEYKEIQKSNRAGIIQENIQPGDWDTGRLAHWSQLAVVHV